jgi:hypothetical protein
VRRQSLQTLDDSARQRAAVAGAPALARRILVPKVLEETPTKKPSLVTRAEEIDIM